MPTTLTQETQRSTDERFRVLVRAAVFRELPNIIGEAILPPDVPNLVVLGKRYAWAMGTLNAANGSSAEIARCAAMLAGENQIRAFDQSFGGVLELPTDAVVVTRNKALINDYSGVTAADMAAP